MAEVAAVKKRGRGRPPGARNKPKIKPVSKMLVPSEAELLAARTLKPTPKIVKEIKRLADESQFTVQQVFNDICVNGIIAVQGMYTGVVETRKALQETLDQLSTGKFGTNDVRQTTPSRNTRSIIPATDLVEPDDIDELGVDPRRPELESFPEEFHDEQFDSPVEPGGFGEAPGANIESIAEVGLDESEIPEAQAPDSEDPANE